MTHSYTFADCSVMSDGILASASVEAILLDNIPGAIQVNRATRRDDRNGTDYWVGRNCDRPLSIDAKVRRQDWWRRHPKEDDLALELWSVVEKEVIGWTFNERKQTDYILWLWQDTGRWCLVPFPMLCAVANDNREEWSNAYRHDTQHTPRSNGYPGGYHSECIFVPRNVVWRAIYERYSGIAP